MKKILLITLLSFFISSVSHSQNKDLLKLKCTYGKNEAIFFYELDIKKLPTAIRSKYNTIADARKVLGKEEEINKVFIDFQKHLYDKKIA